MITHFFRTENANHHLWTCFVIQKALRSAVKRVKFIIDRMLYITVRGYKCGNVLNVLVPTEDKSNDTKNNLVGGTRECI
jgi:hypothetical protein